MHFDPAQPSDLEHLLATHPLDDPNLLARARDAIARLRAEDLSKYTGHLPPTPPPEPGYVLVIDQTRGDAAVRASGATDATFRAMLDTARAAHPAARILIKTHPETQQGHRPGHFSGQDTDARTSLLETPLSPWRLLSGARAVYTVSSQLGFEAILAGHRPHLFGQPFYAGWGLSEDRHPCPRRTRTLSAAQLFAAAMILYPTWYDPCRDRLCALEPAIDTLAAQTRVWREDHRGWYACGMRLWKRPHLQRVFGSHKPLRFTDTPSDTRPTMVWASGTDGPAPGVARIEDGFLRSRGLGAALVPPLSLVCDDIGIYYDPRHPSRLEALIRDRATLRPDQLARVRALITAITAAGLSKYNLPAERTAPLPAGPRILVPGQVADDASLRFGTDAVADNVALLAAVRQANPKATLLYKPHPDVAAGLRPGAIDAAAHGAVETHADPAWLLARVDAVWTMTSLLGFEALLRGVGVTTLGAPFYAGWGLTRDLGQVPARRTARPTREGLVHAALIDYPRYRDPVSGLACPVEVIVARLAAGDIQPPGPANRLLSRVQGLLASQAHLWR